MITPLINLMVTSVKKASHFVSRDFSELEYLRNNKLGAKEFAINANKNLKQNLYKDIVAFKSKYSFILEDEELIDNQDKSNYFYINGIVGLENFSRAIPDFAVSLYLQRDSEAWASVFFNPITNELYFAEKGVGAFCNQKKLKQGERKLQLPDSYMIATDKESINTTNVSKYKNIKINNTLHLDLCYIASQKIDKAIYSNIENIKSIDGALLVAKESGCKVDYNEENKKLLVNYD